MAPDPPPTESDEPPDNPPGGPGGGDQILEWYEQHRPHLQRVAVRLCGNADLAKDLVQETFVRALTKHQQFRQGTDVKIWLVRILTNRFLDRCKHERVERKAEPELATAGEAANPANLIDGQDDPVAQIPVAQLHTAIRALSPDLRAVVELCYLKQMRYREAAELLNVPVSTIGTRLMRARLSLRALLTTSPDGVP